MQKNSGLWKYAGLGFQFIAGLSLFMFLGKKTDSYFKFITPLCIWIFPLIFITAVIIKLVIETGKDKK